MINLRRFSTIVRCDAAFNARRSLYWIWLAMVLLLALGLSYGALRVESGDSSVGGVKAHMTSEFAMARMLAVLTLLFYGFFSAVAAGMVVIHDEECRIGELLHATSLTPREYTWGKYSAALLSILAILAIHVAAMIVCNHALPAGSTRELRGPFLAANYLRPALVFTVPTLIFFTGLAFGIGSLTRKPILVFFLPVVLLLSSVFFLWTYDPAWLPIWADRLMVMLDLTGFRWLRVQWFKVDRGANFYNTQTIPVDGWLLANRALAIVVGLGAVWLSRVRLARSLRGSAKVKNAQAAIPATPAADSITKFPAGKPLKALGMSSGRPGFLAGAWTIGRAELRELISSPGLYLFVPLLIIEGVGRNLTALDPLGNGLILTSGQIAASSFGTLTTLLCFLLMFYTVESFNRDRGTRLAAISMATPVRTGSILLGKAVANGLVGVIVLGVQLLTSLAMLAYFNLAGFEPRPFALLWGVLLVPTLLAWSTFIMAVLAITRNRYTTYAIGLGVITFTGYRFLVNEMNWIGNWPFWGVVRWSDISVLEHDRAAMVLNRLFVLGLFLVFVALAARFYPRTSGDAIRLMQRLRPWPLFKSVLRLAPIVLIPIVLGSMLWARIEAGEQGEAMKERAKNYWRKNLATYKDWPLPDVTDVDLAVDLYPSDRKLAVAGTLAVINRNAEPIRQIPVTPGAHWSNTKWSLDGAEFKPKENEDGQPFRVEDRQGLQIFHLKSPLAPNATARIGFQFEGIYPAGVSKNGGGTMTFIEPSAVVLSSFEQNMAPRLGFVEAIGIDEENRYDSKEYADNYYEGMTKPFFGSRYPFTTRIKVTGPADFTLNSVGVMESDRVVGDRRETVWKSDQPVQFFNVVAGKWTVRKGNGTAIYYNPKHSYNVETLAQALDAARKYYSEWFSPYPWKELKLSEFPALADYAQGFPTNITFSESIGFLTRKDPSGDRGVDAPFFVAAHESAHQWWGNIVAPGQGPGGNLLSEGTSNFSTLLLIEQVQGKKQRVNFATTMEDRYSRGRKSDSERPLVKTDGSRSGDQTVTYDKTGFVMWMLMNHMGRERMLKGIQKFFSIYKGNPDHPVLQDFLAILRDFAQDKPAYDAFTKQWFHEVVVPEYVLDGAKKARAGGTWQVTATLKNEGTGDMPVEVAATRGPRYKPDGGPNPDFREARATVKIGPKGSVPINIQADFEPDEIVVDPDALVLQLRRKQAKASL